MDMPQVPLQKPVPLAMTLQLQATLAPAAFSAPTRGPEKLSSACGAR